MDEEFIQDFLKKNPNASRAATGILIRGEDGSIFHMLSASKMAKGILPEEIFFTDICSTSEIFRLRNIKSAHDYLLRLRANAIADSPRAIRVTLKRRNLYENSRRPWALSHYYHTRDYFHKSYIELLRTKEQKSVKNIPSGLAYISEVNAICMRSFAGDVVVVSESLEYFYYFMTIAFIGDKFDISPLDRLNALLIAVRLVNGSEALDFDIDSRGILEPEVERELQEIVKSQMQFTFGHEYAHYLCGHLNSPDMLLRAFPAAANKNNLNQMIEYSHELEFEADKMSLNFIKHNLKAHSSVATGSILSLIFLHTLELVKSEIALKPYTASETHPHPRERILRLQKSLAKSSPLSDSTVNCLFEISEFLVEKLKRYMENQRKDLLTFYGSIYLPSYKSHPLKDRVDF